MNRYVGIRMADGQVYDGFIAEVDGQNVTLAVPTEEMMSCMCGRPAQDGTTARQFGFNPGFFPRRFFRTPLPLFGVTDLFLLPFFL
ncbi:phosphatidylinositol kinase [Paenibacillus albiflavus]|nr:phosphatidylinositol kinase [Paenibacillus albiflavus]